MWASIALHILLYRSHLILVGWAWKTLPLPTRANVFKNNCTLKYPERRVRLVFQHYPAFRPWSHPGSVYTSGSPQGPISPDTLAMLNCMAWLKLSTLNALELQRCQHNSWYSNHYLTDSPCFRVPGHVADPISHTEKRNSSEFCGDDIIYLCIHRSGVHRIRRAYAAKLHYSSSNKEKSIFYDMSLISYCTATLITLVRRASTVTVTHCTSTHIFSTATLGTLL